MLQIHATAFDKQEQRQGIFSGVIKTPHVFDVNINIHVMG